MARRLASGLESHWPFALLLAAIVATRLWFTFTYPIVQISDYQAYYDEARGFAGLAPLRLTSLYAIGPKLFYSVFFRLFGDSLYVIGVVNAVTYAVAVCVLYAAALRIYGARTAWLSTLVCFVSLSELYFNNLASTETLGTLFVNLIVLLLALGRTSSRFLVGLGVVAGLAIYNRSNMLPIGALVFAWSWLQARDLQKSLARAALVQGVALVVCVPLASFNLSHFGRFTPLIANAATLWYGNNPSLSGDFHSYPPTPEMLPPGSVERRRLAEELRPIYVNPDPDMDFSKMGPYEVGDVRVRYALGWIMQNPWRYLDLVRARFGLFFFSCTYGEAPYWKFYNPSDASQPRWASGAKRLMRSARLPVRRWYQVLIAGAAMGLIATFVHSGPSRFLSSNPGLPFVFIAFYAAPFLLTIGANRYHIPILGLCWIYLAHGLDLLLRSASPLGRRATTRSGGTS